MWELTADWMSFFIVGLGTMFLIGEVLVNAKGIFSILGLSFITVYFASYLDPSMFFIMMMIYIIGLMLIIIDGKILNDGTLAVIGAIAMIISVGFSSPNWVAGLYAVLGVAIGGFSALLFLKVFKKRQMWTKIALFDQLTEDRGYSSMNQGYKNLIGKEGKTITPMRPIGTIEIDGKGYSAISEGRWMEKDKPVVVTQVDGTRILVEELVNNTKD
ncbi:NfeD family protein [Saliterribacillus persicus]|uniref:NfeD-like partner-binding protein n=1 Tax=Saliterribacillus persicus TaxID=930114 RepID=A0A368XDR3_9BACI|nr:NfeD family protein [Saliterribacillus persicus]RCW65356.1 NfeD-like partner-binding protein [Saliterribacillus persicus]